MMVMRTYLALACCILGVAGCTLGPDYQRPDTMLHESETYINAEITLSEAVAASAVSRWWEKMDDPLMNRYVEILLEQNLQLKEAGARVYQALAQLGISKGGLWPGLLASISGSRMMQPAGQVFSGGLATLPGDQDERVYFTQWEAGLSVSWQIDLFGRVRRGIESAEALFQSSQADTDALVHSLIAELARRRVALATLQRQLEFARETVQSRRMTLDAVERRYRLGTRNTSAVDVYLSRENLAAARADEAELSRQLTEQAYALDVLLGYRPGHTDPGTVQLPLLPPPEKPPLGLPAHLLDRRPDLRSAELRLKSATAQIGVAIADMFPDLTLKGSIGFLSQDKGTLFSSSNVAGSIIGEIMMRIFDGGRLKANVDFRRAQMQEQAAMYAGQILNAMQEVETALNDARYIYLRLEELEIQLENIRRAEELAWNNYRRGLRPLLDVLEIQRRRYMSEQTYLMAAQAAWNSRIQLYLALGGDWLLEG
jgi:outer membrane protein, multidrug efflux system